MGITNRKPSPLYVINIWGKIEPTGLNGLGTNGQQIRTESQSSIVMVAW